MHHGTVLGPVLFIIYYINNLDVKVGGMVSTFEDDTKIGGLVNSEGSYQRLEWDLDQWAMEWHMEINAS